MLIYARAYQRIRSYLVRPFTYVWNLRCGKEKEVVIPENVDIGKPHACKQCKERFKSKQGLAVHVRCKHGVVYLPAKVEKAGDSSTGNNSTENPENEKLETVVNEVLKDLMNSDVKSVQPKEQKKRRQYTAKFKAKVIYESESTTLSDRDLKLKYNVDHSLIVRWRKQKMTIYDDAANAYRQNFKKGRRAKKYNQLHAEMFRKFNTRRRVWKATGWISTGCGRKLVWYSGNKPERNLSNSENML